MGTVGINEGMVDAAERVMVRHVVAEEEEIRPEDVTDEQIDHEFELAEADPEAVGRAGFRQIIGDMIQAALDCGGGAVTREPSDLWQAVLLDGAGCVIQEPEETVLPTICMVRASATPESGTGQIPAERDPNDEIVLWDWEALDGVADVLNKYQQAQAMAAGLNAASAS